MTLPHPLLLAPEFAHLSFELFVEPCDEIVSDYLVLGGR